MINEEITKILNRDLVVSTERGVFSSPSEITQHVNALLDASYSTRTISAELQEIGWKKCGTSRAKRKIDNRAQCYYWKQNRKQKALLNPSANTNTQSNDTSSEDGESLASINRRFLASRADKEKSLSKTRETETESAKHKSEHLRIELETKRGELISKAEVKRVWERAIVYMKTNLYTLPERFSQRWASESDSEKIYDEFIKELDALLNRFAQDGERVVTGENEKDFTDDEASDVERDARG